jgi:hypothetical protein
MNPTNPTEVSPAQQLASQRGAVLAEAQARANREPLPGALSDAFKPKLDIDVRGFKVRPVKHNDIRIFKYLDDPFYKQMLEGGTEALKPTQDEIVELCYQFTRPAVEAWMELQKGREHYRLQAMREFGEFEIDDPTLVEVFAAIVQQIELSTSTMLVHTQKQEGKAGSTPFIRQDSTSLATG